MSPELAEYLPIIIGAVIGALVAVFVIWWLSRRSTVVSIDTETKDVLDEGAAPAARNQALIDAPPAKVAGGAPAAPNVELEPAPTPAPTPAPAPAPTPAGADDLTRIKGLGPKIATMLKDQGITTYTQIAQWSDSDIERIDAGLGRFAGRITRDQWVMQAKFLSEGDEAGFAAQFGQNG